MKTHTKLETLTIDQLSTITGASNGSQFSLYQRSDPGTCMEWGDHIAKGYDLKRQGGKIVNSAGEYSGSVNYQRGMCNIIVK